MHNILGTIHVPNALYGRIISRKIRDREQGCQIFLETIYQKGRGEYTKLQLNYQMAMQYAR
jgi:hypothetical protein